MIEIRPTNPNDKLAAFIYSSGPKAFNYVFSQDHESQALEFLAYAFGRNGGEFSHRNHVAIKNENGDSVGAGAGWTTSDALRFQIPMVIQILKFYGLIKGLKVVTRGLKIESIIRPPKKGVYYIGHLGIEESVRGQGIGTKLEAHLTEMAVKGGYKKMGLDVSSENPNAQKLYERLGYKVVEDRKGGIQSKFGQVVDHFYMEKVI